LRIRRVLQLSHELLELCLSIFRNLELDWQHLTPANWADRLSFQDSLHLSVVARRRASGALREVLDHQMLATSSAEWQVVLATWTIKRVLWQIKSTDWARRHLFRFIFCLDGSTCDALNLRLELGWDLHDVFRADQHAGPMVGHAL